MYMSSQRGPSARAAHSTVLVQYEYDVQWRVNTVMSVHANARVIDMRPICASGNDTVSAAVHFVMHMSVHAYVH